MATIGRDRAKLPLFAGLPPMSSGDITVESLDPHIDNPADIIPMLPPQGSGLPHMLPLPAPNPNKSVRPLPGTTVKRPGYTGSQRT